MVYLSTQTFYPSALVLELTFMSLFLGFVNAARGPDIKKIYIPVDDLPDELDGFRVAQISDLHIGHTIRSHYVEKVVKKVNSLGVDLIVLRGT